MLWLLSMKIFVDSRYSSLTFYKLVSLAWCYTDSEVISWNYCKETAIVFTVLQNNIGFTIHNAYRIFDNRKQIVFVSKWEDNIVKEVIYERDVFYVILGLYLSLSLYNYTSVKWHRDANIYISKFQIRELRLLDSAFIKA